MKDLKRKLLSKTIGKNSYWSLNKQLVRIIGLEATLILQHIIDLQEVFQKNEIFQAQPAMANELGITEYAVKNKIVELSKAGYINIVKKGVPCKNYYTTNDDKIINIIVNGLDHTNSTDLPDDYNNDDEIDVSDNINSTDLTILNEQTSNGYLVSTITKNTNQEYINKNTPNNTVLSYGLAYKLKEQLLDYEIPLSEYSEIYDDISEIGWDKFFDVLNLSVDEKLKLDEVITIKLLNN